MCHSKSPHKQRRRWHVGRRLCWQVPPHAGSDERGGCGSLNEMRRASSDSQTSWFVFQVWSVHEYVTSASAQYVQWFSHSTFQWSVSHLASAAVTVRLLLPSEQPDVGGCLSLTHVRDDWWENQSAGCCTSEPRCCSLVLLTWY